MDGLPDGLVSSRLRFVGSFLVVIVIAVIFDDVTGNWNQDLRFGLFFFLAVVKVGIYALRFRYLGMSEGWALLGFIPVVYPLMLLFLLVRNTPTERYSAY